MYNSTKRYAYRVDLNIDVAITSYINTRIAGFLFVVLYSLEYGTPVRHGSTRIYFSYGTVPALFTIRFGRAETVPVLVRARGILFEIQYGTCTVQYSTVAYSYKYKQERGLSTVHCGTTVPVPYFSKCSQRYRTCENIRTVRCSPCSAPRRWRTKNGVQYE